MTFVPLQWFTQAVAGLCPCPIFTNATHKAHTVEKWILDHRHNEEVDLAAGAAYQFSITVAQGEKVSWKFATLGSVLSCTML